jgi:hypothetical protein
VIGKVIRQSAIREIIILGSLLFLAGCATKTVPAPRATPIVPIPAAPRPRPEPPGYAGVSLNALRTRLGTPAFSRKDGPTEMWRYDAGACHAFFFFTTGLVTHIETIPRGPNDSADQACLSALKKPS